MSAPTGALAIPAGDPVASARSGATRHREAARGVLEDHCGLCHLPPSALPDATGIALHIYDLTQDDWSALLTDAQLPILVTKLVDDAATDAEVRILEQFVRDELAWRDSRRPNGGDARP